MNELERLADLGEALSPTDVPRDRLRAKTMTAIAEPPRSRRIPALVAAAAAVLAVGTASTVLVTGDMERTENTPAAAGRGAGPLAARPAAFEVIKNVDGSVTFTVNDLTDLTGATQALNQAGITGRVLTSAEDCTTGPNVVPMNPNDLYPPDTVHRKGEITGTGTVTIRSSDYPGGGGLLVAVHGDVRREDDTLHMLVVAYAYIDAAKIPTCINFVDPGTGPFPPWPPAPRHPK